MAASEGANAPDEHPWRPAKARTPPMSTYGSQQRRERPCRPQSEQRDSNPHPRVWKTRTLPLDHTRKTTPPPTARNPSDRSPPSLRANEATTPSISSLRAKRAEGTDAPHLSLSASEASRGFAMSATRVERSAAKRRTAQPAARHGDTWGAKPPTSQQSRARESHPSLLRTREASSLRRPARRTPRASARDARVAAKGGVEPPSPRLTAERLAIGLLRNSEPDRVALRGRGEVGPRAGVHGEHVRRDDLGEAVVSRRTLCLPCPCKNPCIRVPPHRCRVVRDRCPPHASGERRRGFRELDSNQRDAVQSRVSCR